VEALAYIDLLGFSEMVEKNHNRAKDILNDFYNITLLNIKQIDSVKGHLYSDSLLAYSSEPALLVNVVTEIYQL